MNIKNRKFSPLVLLILVILTIFKVNASDEPCKCKVKYVKKGCYYDPGSRPGQQNRRPLKNLMLNFRDQTDWNGGWNEYLQNVTCRCAELVKEKGFQYFGLQFYGECWSGQHSSDLFAHTATEACWGNHPDYKKCDDASETECIGQAHNNYIYEVTSEEPEDCTEKPHTQKPATEPPRFTACNSRPCHNGGDCVTLETDYLCDCPTDFTGRNCQIKT